VTVRYELNGVEETIDEAPEKPKRPLMQAMMRGAMGRCMSCGKGQLFDGFLATQDACSNCSEEFHHQRADDAPPYFTITIVGHIIIPGLLIVEMMWRPELWIHMAIWIPLTIILSLALMRPIKGALVGLQWAFYMHGFDPDAEDDLPAASPHLESPR
jgi:uncharacterized protein (DUF983 family)